MTCAIYSSLLVHMLTQFVTKSICAADRYLELDLKRFYWVILPTIEGTSTCINEDLHVNAIFLKEGTTPFITRL